MSSRSGIKTVYDGTMFRSRQEAKWAYIFDLLSIPWAYEPTDLAGYIPDFIVGFRSPLLVEIKSDLCDDDLEVAKLKIEDSGWAGEAVILTNVLCPGHAQPLVGHFGEVDYGPHGAQLVWWSAQLCRCLNCGEVTFFPDGGSWHCRRCGAGEGNECIGSIATDFDAAWKQSTNRMQWKAA